jgi:diacylglycerol O-acyltransferase
MNFRHHRGSLEELSAVDAAWRRMDSPTNVMAITVLLTFRPNMCFDAACSVLTEFALTHRRFRQRAVDSRGWPSTSYWQDDAAFDVRNHVHHLRLPAPATRACLSQLVGDLASMPLPGDRPLWQAHLIDDVDAHPRACERGVESGGTVLLLRVHHCIADGLALVRLLLELSERPVRAPKRVGQAVRGRTSTLSARGVRAVRQAGTLGRLLWLPRDPQSALSGELCHRKVLAFSEPISLALIQRLASRERGTVNDVLQSCVAGAVASYLAAQGDSPSESMRAMVPIFLHGRTGELGNHFGLVFLDLSLQVMSARARLGEVQRRMATLKAGEDARIAFATLDAMGHLSPGLEQRALDMLTRKASFLTTNVPGPASPVRICGHELDSLIVWAPTAGHLGLGFTLVSYAGAVRLGVSADRGLVPEPAFLVEEFNRELSRLDAETQDKLD